MLPKYWDESRPARNAQLLQARFQGGGLKAEAFRRAPFATDAPAGGFQDLEDMGAFEGASHHFKGLKPQ